MATSPTQETGINIGRVLSNGFDSLFNNAAPFLGASLILAGVPALILEMFLVGWLADANPAQLFQSGSFWLWMLTSIMVTMATTALLQGILVRSTILHLSGQRVDVGHSIMVAARMILPIIALSIIIGICVSLGFIVLVVPGVIIYCAFIVSVPALVEERKGIFSSMSRSRELTGGSRLLIFLLCVIYAVFYWIAAAVVGGITGASAYSPSAVLVSGVGQMLLATVTSALWATMNSALYVELRSIKEGATPSSLAQVFA